MVIVILGVTLAGCQANKQPFKALQLTANPAAEHLNRGIDSVSQLPSPNINTPAETASLPVQQASFQEQGPTSSTEEENEPTEDTVVPVPEIAPEDSQSDSSASVAIPTRKLDLGLVLRSVTDCFPEIDVAIGEIETARGKVLASWGEFDSVLQVHSISQPLGFYQTYRNGAGIKQPLYGGGEIYGTYRIGDGNFEPWFGERETNEGGEFKAGFSLPLLKDRAIDLRRANVRDSQLNQNQVEANVETRLLLFERFATQAYWDWVASGRVVRIQEQLLELAQTRVNQINIRIEKGDLARIARIDNDQFIAARKNDLIKARRGLEKAAIKLSLFYRDDNCQPIVAGSDQLPEQFPLATEITEAEANADIEFALQSRPELIELAAARARACVDLQYANNLLLPKLDVKGFAGQDLGAEASSTGDKTPFELQLGLHAEVPIQRREGAGKGQAAEGKIAQIDAKRRMVSDKIRAEIQDAASAVNAARDQIEQSLENVQLADESLRLARISFEEGDIDLIALNIYETRAADARLKLLEAEFKYFFGRAAYRTIVQDRAFTEFR